MAEAEDLDELHSKRKAVATLLPYAVWLERAGEPKMLDALLHAARASRMPGFHVVSYRAICRYTLLRGKPSCYSACIAQLFLAYLREGLVQRWAAAVSVAPHTEEIAQSVVDALLWVASNHILLPYTTINTWSWLTTRPSLPPFSMGRYIGTHPNVVRAVRSLEDTKVLKAYLLLLWSEWIPLWDKSSLDEMCASMREDFGGIGIGHHRADLIQRLDHSLRQLDWGLESSSSTIRPSRTGIFRI